MNQFASAVCRALKTHGNTPKYGLIFHLTFIGRAGTKNKGRISRYLANKMSIAARIDCFSGQSTLALISCLLTIILLSSILLSLLLLLSFFFFDTCITVLMYVYCQLLLLFSAFYHLTPVNYCHELLVLLICS